MKRFLSLIVGMVLCFYNLFSQADYREGYIIKLNNDTLQGLINYLGDRANARLCTFKSHADAEKVLYTPNEINGYRFTTGKFYVSRDIMVDSIPVRVFMEYLINGTMDIYYYRDDRAYEHYFIDLGDGKLVRLNNDERQFKVENVQLAKVKGTVYSQKSKEYIGVLKYAFKESPKLANKVNTLSLSHKSLIDITHEYNVEVCKDQNCIIYEKKMPAVFVKFGVLAGIKTTQFTHTMGGSDFSPLAGLYFKVNMPRFNEKLSFQYEVAYSRLDLSYSTQYSTGGVITYYNDISVKQQLLNNIISLRYEFPKGKIRPFFHAGFFVNYVFMEDYTLHQLGIYSWGEVESEGVFHESPFRNDLGLDVGLGALTKISSKRELYMDLSYQRGIGMSPNVGTNSFTLKIGIQLF